MPEWRFYDYLLDMWQALDKVIEYRKTNHINWREIQKISMDN